MRAAIVRRSTVTLAAVAILAGCSNAADQADGDDGPDAAKQSPAGIPSDLTAAESEPVDDPYYPHNGEPYLDTLRYDLTLDWEPSDRNLTGTAKVTFRVTEPRDTVQLDFGKPLEVSTARLDDKQIETKENGEDLVLQTGSLEPDTQHVVTIEYEGTPEPVETSTSRSDMPSVGFTVESDGSAWTMQEPWGAFTWYPVNDHPSDKAYYSATVTAHDGMTGVFNGQLHDTEENGDTTTTNWTLDEPAASYLTTIAIGDYTATTDEGPDGLPLTYWTRPDDEQVLEILQKSPDVLEWLEEQLGPYPFDSGGAVIVPSNSGMETQTMITMGAAARPPNDEYVAVLAHEYAHQWLGDTVTPDNWKDLWLNEGLTMYMEAQWNDHVGTHTLEQQIQSWAQMDDYNRSLYGPPGEYSKSDFATINVYTSGAVMLDRIRKEVGDDVFAEALRGWPQEHRNASVDRQDFITYFSEATGTDIGPFVEKWLTSSSMPKATF